jgi:ABC-2 type transport system permease protein
MSRILRLLLPRLLHERRGRLVSVLLAWPLLLAVLARVSGATPQWHEIAPLYLGTVIPLAALVHASRLIRDEVEGGTIVYLLTRPVPRRAVLLGALAAYAAATLAVALPATAAGFVLSARDVAAGAPSLWGTVAGAVAALLAFGTAFALLGLVLKRPLAIGLLILFGWEQLAGAPGLLPRLTLTAYVRVLAGLSSAPPDVTGLQAALVLGAFAVLCAGLATAVFARREYVPEL